MKKHTAIITLAAGSLTILTGCASMPVPVPPTVTVTTQPTPEPVQSKSLGTISLELAWEDVPASEREQVCSLYSVAPEQAWELFAEKAGDSVTHSEFTAFFDEECY